MAGEKGNVETNILTTIIIDKEEFYMAHYESFAQIYDVLMDDVDYENWADYIKNIFSHMGVKPENILDLACGTGNITIPMAKFGYDMWGVDISEQMLSIAENKSRLNGQKIKFIKQDIRHLNLGKSFDAIICACDGINYIIDEPELLRTFQGVYRFLRSGGVFVFDISSYYKISTILADNTFIEEKAGIFYCWENDFDASSSVITMSLNFFVPDGKLYNRIEEVHIQKAYKSIDIYGNLLKVGFSDIEIFNEFEFMKAHEESERIFFVAKKI